MFIHPIRKTKWPFATAPYSGVRCYVLADADGYQFETEHEKHIGRFVHREGAEGRSVHIGSHHPEDGSALTRVLDWPPEWFIWSATENGELIEKVTNCAEHLRFMMRMARVRNLYGKEPMEVYKLVEQSKEDYYAIGVFEIIENEPGWKRHLAIRPSTFKELMGATLENFPLKMIGNNVAAVAFRKVEDAIIFKLSYKGEATLVLCEIEKIDDEVENLDAIIAMR